MNPPMQPTIISMEVDDDDSFESEYRLLIGNQVRYLVISPGTFDRDTLSFPLQSLPYLPYNVEWTVANISRDKTTGDLKISFSNRKLAGVKSQWHHIQADCQELEDRTAHSKGFRSCLTFDPSIHAHNPSHGDCQNSPLRMGDPSHRTGNESISVA